MTQPLDVGLVFLESAASRDDYDPLPSASAREGGRVHRYSLSIKNYRHTPCYALCAFEYFFRHTRSEAPVEPGMPRPVSAATAADAPGSPD